MSKRPRKPDSPRKKLVKKIARITTAVLIFPFLATIIALAILPFSYKEFFGGRKENAKNSILLSRTFFVASEKESQILKYIPLLGRIYGENIYISRLGLNVSDIALTAMPVIENSSSLFNKVLGNEVYDPAEYSGLIKSDLEFLERKLVLVRSDTESQASGGLLTARFILKKFDFNFSENLISSGKVFFDKLPLLLGKAEKKSYLVLFQNNMELRPTGGFIGSYGVMDMDSGRMTELSVNDIYSADGQLKGHVEPPAPIKNYLGEANWWFRDSNWDPDFPTSAKRAEWFLDKETDRRVDGVFSTDLETVKDILHYTGPIFLPDYNMDITEDNLYERTQEEVQREFFPGSRKKASFLTALTRSLIAEVQNMEGAKKIRVLASLFSNLQERHLQIYMHDANVQSAISRVNWDGAVSVPLCGENCYQDYLGLVEANVGVNKANFFVTRRVDLAVNISAGSVSHTLSVNFKNSANPALGPSGKYKVYVRILVPAGSEIVNVAKIAGINEEKMSQEISKVRNYQEVGVLAEILPGEDEKIIFSWINKDATGQSSGNYGIFIRKQAGTIDDLWNIALSNEALTGQAVHRYNVVLAKDFFAKISK